MPDDREMIGRNIFLTTKQATFLLMMSASRGLNNSEKDSGIYREIFEALNKSTPVFKDAEII